MPIYEYQCESCGQVFDVLQKLSDPPVKSCKICKGRKVRKLLGTPALQFKGSGWYVTDYAGKNAASGKPDKPDAKPGTDKKSDDKPAGAPSPSCACGSGGCKH